MHPGKIKAYWHGLPNSNFGDMLTPIIIKAISGMEAQFTDWQEPSKILSIGSILSIAQKGDTVWGSGVLHPGQITSDTKDINFKMVRGPLTRDCLRHKGAEVPDFVADPAVLLPFIYDVSTVIKDKELAIFPHVCSFNEFSKKNTEIIIDVCQKPHLVLTKIAQCQAVVTESMHVMMLAEALDIPTVLIQTTTNHDYDFTWKFQDYYLSTNREFIQPVIWGPSGYLNYRQIQQKLDAWISPPKPDYAAMLKSCPFNFRNITSPTQLIKLPAGL